ncbi:hypothetical protein DXG01_004428 [Tephrocybe rancida]|nr:hypothetical protein DXG01_004428 [Tephrocybe rancida]
MASTNTDLPGSLTAKQQHQENEAAGDDLFSALFSHDMRSMGPGHIKPKSRPVNRQDASESDSEFGAFVSVSAMEDPLTALDFGLPSQEGPSFINETPVNTSSSLTFFDKFAQDAKVASYRNKQEVLDELLNHEDDPLYWLKGEEDTPEPAVQSTIHTPADLLGFDEHEVDVLDLPQEVTPVASHTPVPHHDGHITDRVNVKSPVDDLLDLDQEFFTVKPQVAHPHPHRTTRPDQSPSRSSTLALPVLPAPPLADTHNASFTASSSPNEADDPLSQYARRSSSYSTLSNISSRWMSSLLPSSKSHPHHSHPALDSIFAADHTPPKRSQSSERTPPSPTLHRTASHPASDVQISHGTPFGRSVKAKASPFASHTYTPPTGAPGYHGEQYNWDKGFSADLDRELNGEEAKERELVGMRGEVPPSDVGHLMERKMGSVDFIGRKALTVPVLELRLADMIRSHLPALARLPKKWTLVYSLDQHGISLNTLYDRCEAHMQVKPGTSGPAGALVVVKDSGDGLFGAWMGKEGVRPSRGKGYYGSGESFLWKYIGGKLQVYKWTGRNDYIALCEPGFISFGGGDGNYGLYLDDRLLEGSSAACPTFANEPLCSPGAKNAGVVSFECVGLEVWVVGP